MNVSNKSMIIWLCALLLFQDLTCLTNATGSDYFPAAINKQVYSDWLATVSYNKSTFIESSYDTTLGAAVHWNINADDGMIYLAVAVTQATGWVGFGLAEAGSMRGADIVMYTAETDTLTDTYVLDELVTPFTDTCQSWELLNSVVDGGFIIFEAKRLLNTSDTQDRAIIDDSNTAIVPTRVIAAWGNSTGPSFHSRSVARGAIRFFGTSDSINEEEFFTKTMADEAEGNFTLSGQNFIIPSDVTTTYARFCVATDDLFITKSVPIDQALHVIGFEPYVQPGNEQYVHHYVLYGSSLPFNVSGNCDEYPRIEVAYVWAPGDLPTGLPLNVGGPLGVDGYQSFLLEIHYTNFDLNANVTDDSGVRIFYTSNKREFDLGILQIGDPFVQLFDEAVSPIGGLAQHSFVCDGGCLGQYMTEPVTVIRESLHMHMTGTSMVNYHIRDEEVIRRGLVNFWDFDQQGDITVVQAPFQMNPGDSFRTVCNYNSTSEVTFGLASDQEMCIAFLWYYPRVLSTEGFPIMCGLGVGDLLPPCEATYNATPDFRTSEQLERTFGGTPSFTCPNLNMTMPAVVPNPSPMLSPVAAPPPTTSSTTEAVVVTIISSNVFVALSIFMVVFN